MKQPLRVHVVPTNLRWHPLCWTFLCFVCQPSLLGIGVVSADDGDSTLQDPTMEQLQQAPVSSNVEAVVLSMFFFLCATSVAIFGVLLAYFSIQEDKLMRHYHQQGIKLNAHVWSADFTRIRPASCTCDAATTEEHDHEEYTAIIDYRVLGDCECGDDPSSSDSSCWVVRKQVKACGSDFVRAKAPSYMYKMDKNIVRLEFHDDCPIPTGSATTKNHDLVLDGEPNVPLELEVLVLPKYKNSALPAKQVQRVCSLSYRLPTALMLVCTFCFVLICILMGLVTIQSMLSNRESANNSYDDDLQATYQSSRLVSDQLQLLLWYSGVAFLGLMVFAMALTHWCWAQSIQRVLQAEYLEGGDMILPNINGDSFSIASGDDSYLRL